MQFIMVNAAFRISICVPQLSAHRRSHRNSSSGGEAVGCAAQFFRIERMFSDSTSPHTRGGVIATLHLIEDRVASMFDRCRRQPGDAAAMPSLCLAPLDDPRLDGPSGHGSQRDIDALSGQGAALKTSANFDRDAPSVAVYRAKASTVRTCRPNRQ
jgi:hypothetical protein